MSPPGGLAVRYTLPLYCTSALYTFSYTVAVCFPDGRINTTMDVQGTEALSSDELEALAKGGTRRLLHHPRVV